MYDYKGKGKGKGDYKGTDNAGLYDAYKGKGKGKGSYKGGKGKGTGKSSYYDKESMVPGVAICYYDPYKRIHTTECVDPNDEQFVSMYTEQDDYDCGCCSLNSEFSGMLPDYCPLSKHVGHSVQTGYMDQPSVSTPISVRQPPSPGTQAVAPVVDYDCMNQDESYQVCGRPDVFVHGEMYAMCRYDVRTRTYDTVCVHHTMRHELIEDNGGRYSCGCCEAKEEGSSRPGYCQL